MAFDESLAARIRDVLARRRDIEEKKMFGGVCFLLNGNLLVGVWKDALIARLGPGEGEAALREPHVITAARKISRVESLEITGNNGRTTGINAYLARRRNKVFDVTGRPMRNWVIDRIHDSRVFVV